MHLVEVAALEDVAPEETKEFMSLADTWMKTDGGDAPSRRPTHVVAATKRFNSTLVSYKDLRSI